MKRISLIIALIFIIAFAKESFAVSGWQFGLNIPIGASFGFYKVRFSSDASQTYKDTYAKRDTSVGFDSGLTVQAGYFVGDGDKGISLLLDLGYSHDTFASYSKNKGSASIKDFNCYIFESMVFGIYPKFNWNKFSFGIAGGIKVPLYARVKDSVADYQNSKITQNIEIIKANQLKNVFKVPIIPYLKFSVDYLIYSDKKLNLFLGGYIGYDFGIYLKTPKFNDSDLRKVIKQNISSFDLGFQIGIKII